jgi:hypothetical protein
VGDRALLHATSILIDFAKRLTSAKGVECESLGQRPRLDSILIIKL